MHTSILTAAFRWLWDHKPDVMIMLIMIVATIWITNQVNSFGHRLERVEEMVIDIHERQLPEMLDDSNERFKAVDEKFKQVDRKFEKIEGELSEIKLFMKKIDTYLATKNKDYKGEE